MQVSEVIGFQKGLSRYEPDTSLPLPTELVGVEVELEGCQNMPSPSDEYWNVTRDGSLRNNGKEYVFREPLYGLAIQSALRSLQDCINVGEPTVSSRCSVHVHINISDLTTAQLHKFLLLYIIFERTLVRFHKSSREDNIFCVPFYKAPKDIAMIDALVEADMEGISNMFANFDKYYAVNLRAIQTFGSLEFRHMGGSTEMPDVFLWIKIIMCLKKASLNEDYNPYNLITNISGRGPRSIFYSIFGEFAAVLEHPELEMDIMKGVRLAQLSVIDKDLYKLTDHFNRVRIKADVLESIQSVLQEEDEFTFTMFGPEEGDI